VPSGPDRVVMTVPLVLAAVVPLPELLLLLLLPELLLPELLPPELLPPELLLLPHAATTSTAASGSAIPTARVSTEWVTVFVSYQHGPWVHHERLAAAITTAAMALWFDAARINRSACCHWWSCNGPIRLWPQIWACRQLVLGGGKLSLLRSARTASSTPAFAWLSRRCHQRSWVRVVDLAAAEVSIALA
jgi:hypothetical protein